MSKNCARIAIWQTVSSLIFMAFPMAILVLLLVYGEKRSLAQEFYTPYNFVAFLILKLHWQLLFPYIGYFPIKY
jgi:hypothetical protein